MVDVIRVPKLRISGEELPIDKKICELVYVWSLQFLGKGSFCKRVCQIIRLNTLVDVIRVPKLRISGEELPIDKKICELVYVWSLQFLGKGSSNLWVHL